MISSFLVSAGLLVLRKNGLVLSTHIALLITIAITTVCWILTAFLGPRTDHKTLVDFYKKIRPFGPGWTKIRKEAGIPESEARSKSENFPLALIGWVSGCTMIWSALFTVGNFLYGRMTYAFILLGVFIASGLVLLKVINILWSPDAGKETPV